MFIHLGLTPSVHAGEAALTDVTVASSEPVLALTLILVGLGVGAGPSVLAGLVGAAVVQV